MLKSNHVLNIWDKIVKEKRMRRLDLTVQQKCTIFLFLIAAIHIGGLIWIVIAEDLWVRIFSFTLLLVSILFIYHGVM